MNIRITQSDGRNETHRGQPQYARALYHESPVFAAEGKAKLKKRSLDDAKRALYDARAELGLDELYAGCELSKADFESVLEWGYT